MPTYSSFAIVGAGEVGRPLVQVRESIAIPTYLVLLISEYFTVS